MNSHSLRDLTFFSNKLFWTLGCLWLLVGKEMPADRQRNKEPANIDGKLGGSHLLILTMPTWQHSFPPVTTCSWLWFHIWFCNGMSVWVNRTVLRKLNEIGCQLPLLWELWLLKMWREPGLVQIPFYRRANWGGDAKRWVKKVPLIGRVSSSLPPFITRHSDSSSLLHFPLRPPPDTPRTAFLVMTLPWWLLTPAADCNHGFSQDWCQFFLLFFLQ